MTWRERIVAARERGHFTGEDFALSANWCSCAVGEQLEKHPDVVAFAEEEPIDRELGVLGDSWSGFAWAVKVNNISEADRILDAIEDRVLQLKREVIP